MSQNEYLKIESVSKQFGAVKALDDVSFSIARGEIHALLGENGAGKSTLVKIIMGEQGPDSGTITLAGEKIEEYHPLAAQARGIQMVHQELAIFENLSVAENMFPQFIGKPVIRWKELYQKTQEALDTFGLKTIRPDQKMDTVTLAGQQMIEILRCIQADPKVLLLDEPTSGLNNEEASRLMEILRSLRARGLTIIYISHRLKELIEITDRITIMRDGHYICTLVNDNIEEQALINNMVGRELSGSLYQQKVYSQELGGETLYEVRGLRKANALEETSFSLYQNEVLGFFGLEGSGTDKLSRMLFGLERVDHGEIIFKRKKIPRIIPREMIQNEIMYLNGNRKNAGLLMEMPITDNISMPLLKKLSGRMTFIDQKKLNATTEEYIDKFSIVVPSAKSTPLHLSGGNQQKVMMAICSAPDPKLLIVNEPTRGIDVGVKVQIHKYLMDAARQGTGIIVFSSELPELIAMCDRVIVMNHSRIAGEVSGSDISEQSIMKLAAGTQRKGA